MSKITIQASSAYIKAGFTTGLKTRRTVISKGLPADAELLHVCLNEIGIIEYLFDCPSDQGEDRITTVEITTLDDV